MSELTADNLTFGYSSKTVGAGVSFSLRPGEVLCLLGPNGSGKTTLFKTLLGLMRPLGGRVLLDGRDVGTLSRTQLARSVAYVPQAHASIFPFTVRDIVLMGRASRIGAFGIPSVADRAVAAQVLDGLGIGWLADRIYTEISGGERQLALIARALAQEPSILVMDEPTASLDFGNQARVLSQIRGLSSGGITVVLSTHDPDHAFLCADRVAMLHQGRLAALGAPQDMVTSESLQAIYGVAVTVAFLPQAGHFVCSPSVAARPAGQG